MDRVRELECRVEEQRGAVKAILAGAAKEKRGLNQEERDRSAELTEQLRSLGRR